MLIIRDTTGVTIKRTSGDMDHVRIGVFQTTLWQGGIARRIRYSGKPHGEFDMNDCAKLLTELESLPVFSD